MKNFLTLSFATFLVAQISAQEMGSFVDTRNNKEYKTTKLGDQVWMAENLAYKVPEGVIEYCWPYGGKKKNIKAFGYLYNWEGAKKGCPVGWHLPSDDEWKKLELFIGCNEVQVRDVGSRKNKPAISFRVRSKEGWPRGQEGTNEMGFNMLPAGESGAKCCYQELGKEAAFWTSTGNPRDNAEALYRVFYDDGTIASYHRGIYHGRSVRCVKD